MSIQTAHWIICDNCGTIPADDTHLLANPTVRAARDQARRAGWTYERRVRRAPSIDLCPECVERLDWKGTSAEMETALQLSP